MTNKNIATMCTTRWTLTLATVFILCQAHSQQSTHVLLSGNTADVVSRDSLIHFIDRYCLKQTSSVIWVLNGDLFGKDADDEQIRTWSQSIISLLDKHALLQVVINQGDRDWASDSSGWKQLKHLQRVIESNKHARLRTFFQNGCPGPSRFSVGEHLEVVVINSEWFNRKFDKPLPDMNICAANEDIFLEDLRDILDENSNKSILLLTHYPVIGAGNYSGKYSAMSYLFPPVVGAIRVAYHQHVGSAEDISNENLMELQSKLNDLLQEFQGVVVASGHEKNHSIIRNGANVHINSGAVVKGNFVDRSSLFASNEPGMMELVYTTSGDVSSRFIPFHDDNRVETSLWRSSCNSTVNSPVNPSWNLCSAAASTSASTTSSNDDFQTQAAGIEYKAGSIKRFWVGQHYRSSWITPVRVGYLNLDSTFGGLTVIGRGGGRQTTSLKFKAANGKEYVYRSVNKDPAKALTYSLRGTIVSDILRDQTSTQQPYGALVASSLLDQTGILHASPALYVLRSTDKLGSYEDEFKDLMGFLEERPTDKIDDERIFGKADHIEKSHQLFSKLYADHDNRVDAHEFATARVFDILVGDWGKHEDNWKWAGYKTKGGEIFRPIPRDRDHVFSRWDGILPYLADRAWAKPSGEDFDYTIKGLRSLMWQARHLDRQLGNSLSREDWINAAQVIQEAISDDDIEAAVRKMPESIYSTDGKVIEAKLKARRKDLQQYAERYYRMLSPQVDVIGSNKREYFQIDRKSDGSVTVDMYDLDPDTQRPVMDRRYYHREFVPHETKEIRIFGLRGDDVFIVTGKTTNSILIRIIGGDGDDLINDSSDANGKQTRIYDRQLNSGSIYGPTTRRVTPKEESLYSYNRTAFAYHTYFPMALISYNPFTGLTFQSGITFTRHNFDKPDFSARHSIKGSFSLEKNYGFEYENRLRHVIGKWDFTSRFSISRPLNYNYFFGIGNNTENNDDQGSNYYRAQYDLISTQIGLLHTFWKQSSIQVAATVEFAEGVRRDNSFLYDHPDIFGTERLELYFLETNLDIDFRNTAVLPERGFRFFVSNAVGHIPQSTSAISSIAELGIEQYISTSNVNPLTFGVRLGGGTTTGELPFYKLLSLGQLNDLRGFKRNRFTGVHKAYLNTELRWQIMERRNSFIPVKVGVNSFFDVGRVWADSDSPTDRFYHVGYGAGLYVVPFLRRVTLTASAGFSPEESMLLMFGVGTSAFR